MLYWKSYLPYLRTLLDDEHDIRFNDCLTLRGSNRTDVINTQKEKLLALFESLGSEDERAHSDTYIDHCIRNDIPYLYVSNEIANVAKALLGHLAEQHQCGDIVIANRHFRTIEGLVSEGYYRHFLRKLAAKNHIRLTHLSHLVEKHLMIHYQHHLEWMLVLIGILDGSASEEDQCELDHNRCSFGQWLHNPTLPYITNTSHFLDIKELHILLHDLGKQIYAMHASGEAISHKRIIQLLERLDYTSLEIGNEIAIINDMLIIGEYSKDPMTGLLGRRLFERVVIGQLEIAKATETECAMMMCDLDDFKGINDSYGHLVGDAIIKDFAELLKTTLRKSDFIFRFGGEEFFVVLPSTGYEEARMAAQHICDLTRRRRVENGGEAIAYTVSIGVTGVDTAGLSFVTKETIHKYVQDTDARLYIAKRSGRDRVA